MCYQESDFYCIACGKRGLPVQRPSSHKRERFHRKKLYCIHCKTTVNHIECKDDFEASDFKELFSNGYFQEEAEISLKECAENG